MMDWSVSGIPPASKWRMQRCLFALLFVSTLGAGACRDDNDSPVTPTPNPQVLNLAGTWRADIDLPGNPARMVWTLSQNGTAVSGPVTFGLQSGTVVLNGTLTGTATATSLTYTIAVAPGGIPLNPACTGQLGGTVTGSSTTLTGPLTVVSSTCAPPIPSTTITLTRG